MSSKPSHVTTVPCPYKMSPLSSSVLGQDRCRQAPLYWHPTTWLFKRQSRCLNKVRVSHACPHRLKPTHTHFRKPASPVEGQAQKEVRQPSLRGQWRSRPPYHLWASSPLPGDGTFVLLFGQHPLTAGWHREKLLEHDFPQTRLCSVCVECGSVCKAFLPDDPVSVLQLIKERTGAIDHQVTEGHMETIFISPYFSDPWVQMKAEGVCLGYWTAPQYILI